MTTDAVRETIQSALTLWARLRHRPDFERVQRFCMFVGYPRSGHTLVGSLLNAHPNAVISHELDAATVIVAGCSRNDLYARILARASWFALRGNRSNYDYQVANQWQGRFRDLRVIGDKRGGSVTRTIAAHPDFLDRVRSLVRVPLRLIHIVRNPFDNIAAIALWHELSLADAADYYFRHCETTARLEEISRPGELLNVRHEDMLLSPREHLASLCSFLELDSPPDFLEDCCRIVFPRPTYTRQKVSWPARAVSDIEVRMRKFPLLEGYAFERPED